MPRWRLTRKMWAVPLAALVAIGIVGALAVYVHSFYSISNLPIPLSTGHPGAGGPHGSSAPSEHRGKNGSGTPGGSGHAPDGVHALVVHVRSSEPIGVISYLVPTSPRHSYGKVKNVGKSWTFQTRVTGRPKYAIVWIKGAQDGTSVHCSIAIDGKVVVRKRTKGPYGLQICSG